MASDLFSLEGEVVVVTGALGQLGAQYTAALLGCGARVAMLDLAFTSAALPALLKPWVGSDTLMTVQADVTNRSTLVAALDLVRSTIGAPTGLVNNAALDSPPGASSLENGPFETYPEESWDRVLSVNTKGVFLACQVFGGFMATEGRGSIVNVSSIYGMVSPDQRYYEDRRSSGEEFFKPVAYSASKSALMNLTRYLATYWAPHVRVNTITLAGVANNQDKAFLEKYESRVPLARMAREDEYNGSIIYLLSTASSYMTGANLVVDGGYTAW